MLVEPLTEFYLHGGGAATWDWELLDLINT